MGKTIAEKILSRACGRDVKPGEIVYPRPDLVVLTDTQAFNRIQTMKSMGIDTISDPEKYVVPVGHLAVTSIEKADMAKGLRKFAANLGIKHFYDQGHHGVEHILVIEEGLARPGMLIFGGDTHMPTVGAVGAVGIPLPFELLSILTTGTVWIRVPKTLKVELTGILPRGTLSRDLIMRIIKDIGAEHANYRILEFTGPGISHIGIAGRMTLCNVPVQIGAKAAVVEMDKKTSEYIYIKVKGKEPLEIIKSDPDAVFEHHFAYNLNDMEPMVALPPGPDNVVPVKKASGITIHKAVLGCCVNGMLDDLKDAAKILKGRKISPSVRMVISPGTQRVFLQAVRTGVIETFLTAGATIIEPGCPICYGAVSPLASGETCITTTARNEPGRMGSFEASIYLASPATVAASAIKGEITDPREYL